MDSLQVAVVNGSEPDIRDLDPALFRLSNVNCPLTQNGVTLSDDAV